MNNQKGIVWIPILVMVVAVAAFSAMAYLVLQKNTRSTQTTDLTKPPVEHVAKDAQNTELIKYTNEDLGITFSYSPSLGPIKTQTLTPGHGTEAGKEITIEFTESGTTSSGSALQILATSPDLTVSREYWFAEALSRGAAENGFTELCSIQDLLWSEDIEFCSVNSTGDQVTMVLALHSFGDRKTVINFAKLVAIKTTNPDYPVAALIVYLPKYNSPVVSGDDTATITKKVKQIITTIDHPEKNLLEYNSILSTLRYTNESANRKVYSNAVYGYSIPIPREWKVKYATSDQGEILKDDVLFDHGSDCECKDEIKVEKTSQTLEKWKDSFDPKNVVKTTNITLDGTPAIRVDTATLNVSYIATIKDGYRYLITSTGALLSDFELWAFSFYSSKVPPTKLTSWKTYTNAQYNFTLSIPSTWKIAPQTYSPDKNESVSPVRISYILYEPDNSGEITPPYVRVGFWPNPENKTLGELFDDYYKDCVGSQGGNKHTCQNAQDADGLYRWTLNDHQAYWVGADQDVPNDSLTDELYVKTAGGYVVLEGFPDEKEGVQSMMDAVLLSLQFTK